uniref:FAM86 N-terminal domain-containing protein n=1 Tax=Pan paniscus TaxID=9597 RepID=A0A2R9AWH8_PANPA
MAPEENTGIELLLQSFERRFLAVPTLCSLPWQSLEAKLRDSSDSELLRDILQKTVKHPVCVKHPPSVKYAWCFLSELIKKHEAVHMEPLDELYEALVETLMAKESTQGHRKGHPPPPHSSVTLSENMAIISHGTTGLVTWDAALYVAEWAIENPAAFTHRSVLELGSGTGLTDLAICKICHPRAYIFRDCHSPVLEQLQGNVLLNGLSLEADINANLHSPRLTMAQLDWDVVTVHQHVVIAAGNRLAACREHQRAPEVYVAFAVRNRETCQLFTTELGEPPCSPGPACP